MKTFCASYNKKDSSKAHEKYDIYNSVHNTVNYLHITAMKSKL
jgi:hypothetical protein